MLDVLGTIILGAIASALCFAFFPGFLVRLSVRFYPVDSDRREELIAELYAQKWRERVLFAFQTLELAINEGIPDRVRERTARRTLATEDSHVRHSHLGEPEISETDKNDIRVAAAGDLRPDDPSITFLREYWIDNPTSIMRKRMIGDTEYTLYASGEELPEGTEPTTWSWTDVKKTKSSRRS